jgi:energy-converting hydrogenase Eha subunit A
MLGIGVLVLLAQLQNYKQLSLISLIANIGVVLALMTVYLDGSQRLYVREENLGSYIFSVK